jgi:hypothetical protein
LTCEAPQLSEDCMMQHQHHVLNHKADGFGFVARCCQSNLKLSLTNYHAELVEASIPNIENRMPRLRLVHVYKVFQLSCTTLGL